MNILLPVLFIFLFPVLGLVVNPDHTSEAGVGDQIGANRDIQIGGDVPPPSHPPHGKSRLAVSVRDAGHIRVIEKKRRLRIRSIASGAGDESRKEKPNGIVLALCNGCFNFNFSLDRDIILNLKPKDVG